MIENSAQRGAKVAARAADWRKAEDVLILKMPEIMADTEYFVICSAPTDVQVRAIVNSITGAMADEGFEILRHEGRGTTNWVLLDYGNVVVHVFLEEDRRYYDLERLWADAERIAWA